CAFWTVFHLPSMVLQFGREEVMVVRHVRAPLDRGVILAPLQVTGGARWNGRLIDEGQIVVCRPGAEVTAADPAGMEVAVVSMPVEAAPLPVSDTTQPSAGLIWLQGDSV